MPAGPKRGRQPEGGAAPIGVVSRRLPGITCSSGKTKPVRQFAEWTGSSWTS